MKKKLCETSGESGLHMGIVCIVGVLLIAAALSVIHVFAVCSYTRSKVDEAVLAVAAYNVAEFYGGARELSGQARHPLGGNQFASTISSDDVIEQLSKSIGGEVTGNTITKESWSIVNLSTRYVNYEGGQLNFRTQLTVRIPFQIGNLPPITLEKHMEVASSYAPKF